MRYASVCSGVEAASPSQGLPISVDYCHTLMAGRHGEPAERCPDSPRYKACGNSMCVNVMRWIGMRIENVERKIR